MQAFACTIPGFEDVAAEEVKELISARAICKPSVILFETSEQDLAKLTYKAQSLVRTAQLLAQVVIDKTLATTEENITKALEPTLKDIPSILKKKTFKVITQRKGDHHFSSQEISAHIGALFAEKKLKVEMENPEMILFVFIHEEQGYLGIDYTGIDLSKRDYKIYPHPEALNGALAFSLLKLAGYTKEKTLLDPFCGSSSIAIEAALKATNTSPNLFRKDKLRCGKFLTLNFETFDSTATEHALIHSIDANNHHISTSKKNAKIANVQRAISFSRTEVEWLDTKLEKSSIDLIVTQPPIPSKNVAEKDVEKVYKEFFYQLKYILKPKGKVVCIAKKTELLEKTAKDHTITKRTVLQGEQAYTVVSFTPEIVNDTIKTANKKV